jgi:hypothetical protein
MTDPGTGDFSGDRPLRGADVHGLACGSTSPRFDDCRPRRPWATVPRPVRLLGRRRAARASTVLEDRMLT